MRTNRDGTPTIRRRRAVAPALLVPLLLAPARAGQVVIDKEALFSALDGGALDRDGKQNGVLDVEALVIQKKARLIVDVASAFVIAPGGVTLQYGAYLGVPAEVPLHGPTLVVWTADAIVAHKRARIDVSGVSAGGLLRLVGDQRVQLGLRARIRSLALDGVGEGGVVEVRAGKRVELVGRNRVDVRGGSGGRVIVAACAGDPQQAVRVMGSLSVLAVGLTGPGGQIDIEARAGGVDLGDKCTLLAVGALSPGEVRVAAATKIASMKLVADPPPLFAPHVSSVLPCAGFVPDVAVAPFALDVTASPLAGAPGTQFDLTAAPFAEVELASVEWDLGDGSSASGATIAKSYAEPGYYFVKVIATAASGAVVEDGVLIAVLPEPGATQGPLGVTLPALPGDVDGDGVLALADALRIAQHAEQVRLLATPAEFLNADVDLDGVIDASDAQLSAQAVLLDDVLPDALLDDQGAPGKVVEIVSLHLRSAATHAVMRIGSETVELSRSRPGHGTFYIPLDTPAGPTVATLLQDGVAVADYPLTVLPPYASADPPGTLLFAALDAVASAHAQLVEVYAPLLDRLEPTPEERAVVMALLSVAEADYATIDAQVRALLMAMPPNVLAVFEQVAHANGLSNVLDVLPPDNLLLATLPGDAIVAEICKLKAIAGSAAWWSGAISTTCDVVFVGSVLVAIAGTGPTGSGSLALLAALLTTLSGWCALAAVPQAVVETVDELVPDLSKATLHVTADPTVLSASMPTAQVNVLLQLKLIDDPCANAGGNLADKLRDKVVLKVLTKGYGIKWILKALDKLPEKLAGELKEKIEDAVKDAVSDALDDAGLDDLFDAFQTKVCDQFGLAGLSAGLPLDPNGALQPIGADQGSLVLPAPGSGDPALYTCPADPAQLPGGKVTLTAEKSVCGVAKSDSIDVLCASGMVMITMGDNGSALDDIFLVRVDGQTVLTSSAPVTSVSTTVQLAFGEHTVSMSGLAAPDGIGTYFIQFSGATVVSGPPLSGSNLVPGVTHTWTIQVP